MVQKRDSNVSWEDIEAILVVSQSGSMREAARTLGVSHTTVARRVNNAELSMGAVAFIRSPTGHALTAAGEKIVEHAKEMQNAAENMKRVVTDLDETPSGLVRVTMPLGVLTIIVTSFIQSFYEEYPDIKIEFQVGQSFSDLENYGSDIAIRFQNEPSPDLFGTCIGQQFEGIYGDRTFIDRHMERGTEVFPFVTWGDSFEVEQRLAKHGFKNANIRFLCDDVQAQASLAAAGHGLAILPCLFPLQYPNLSLFPKTVPLPSYKIWVLTHNDLKSSERIRIVSRFLTQELRTRIHLLQGRTI